MSILKIVTQQIRKAKKILKAKLIRLKEYLLSLFGIDPNLEFKNISGKNIWIRKKTPDFRVALSCFNGEFDIIKNLFPKDYSGVIIDAGGYIGTAAIMFSEMYPKATILTIEPSKDNFRILQKNISNYKNIKPIYGALVASNEEKVVLRNRKTGAWGYTIVEHPKDRLDAGIIAEVPAFRLSSLGVKIEDIGILKLDIEGGEYAIMKDDYENLQLVPVILAELHDKIVEGCSELFFSFSKNRIVSIDEGEKYLSIKKEFN